MWKLLISLLFLTTFQNTKETDTFEICITLTGCGEGEQSCEIFSRKDKQFVSKDRAIPVDAINEIRKVVLQAPKDPSAFTSQIANFETKVRAQREFFRKSLFCNCWQDSEELTENKDKVEKLVDPENVIPIIAAGLTTEAADSSLGVEIGLSLPGNPPMKITSHPFPRACLMP